jgi:hypothetical protein
VNRQPLFIDDDGNRFDNVITKINFYYQGELNGIVSKFNSSVSLAKPNINTYKPFAELTEVEMLAWLETSVSSDEIGFIQSVIVNRIEDMNTLTSPPYATSF